MVLGLADKAETHTGNLTREVGARHIFGGHLVQILRQPCRNSAQTEWDIVISVVAMYPNTRLVPWRALGRSDTLEMCSFTRVGFLAVAIQPYSWRLDGLAVFQGKYDSDGGLSLSFLDVFFFGNTMFILSNLFCIVGSGADGLVRS